MVLSWLSGEHCFSRRLRRHFPARASPSRVPMAYGVTMKFSLRAVGSELSLSCLNYTKSSATSRLLRSSESQGDPKGFRLTGYLTTTPIQNGWFLWRKILNPRRLVHSSPSVRDAESSLPKLSLLLIEPTPISGCCRTRVPQLSRYRL